MKHFTLIVAALVIEFFKSMLDKNLTSLGVPKLAAIADFAILAFTVGKVPANIRLCFPFTICIVFRGGGHR